MTSAPEDLRDANAQIERMQDALNWYAEMAKTMRRATLHVDNQVALHILKEMALDGGKRAREALTPNTEVTRLAGFSASPVSEANEG